MAQSVQIVPKYAFPHVETYVNDYTVWEEDSSASAVSENEKINMIAVFTSDKGEDNKFIKKETLKDFRDSYGKSNFRVHGQPLMMPIAELATGRATVWCMRVMPDNATYANAAISAWYKADTADTVTQASKRKFRLKFTAKYFEGVTTKESFVDICKNLDGEAVKGKYTDSEGFVQAPVVAARTAGRGKYGNKDAIRIVRNLNYEKDYGIKMFTFESMNGEEGMKTTGTYVGAVVTATKYNNSVFINDILEDVTPGTAPNNVYVYEDEVENIYEAYINFVKTVLPDVEAELAGKITEYAVPENMMNGSIPVSEEHKAHYDEIMALKALIESAKDLPDEEQFDLFFGYRMASSTEKLPFIEYQSKDVLSDDPAYTATDIINLDDPFGIQLLGGTDGDLETIPVGKTREAVMNECYINAFNGTFDRNILSPKRIPADALFDANYDFSVKEVMYQLAKVRNDANLYLDAGLVEAFTDDAVNKLVEKFEVFDHADVNDTTVPVVSKNVQHYYVKDPDTKKRVPVTITYFLAQRYPVHVIENGIHTPFVKANCELSGHIRDSLTPPVDDFEYTLKEKLYDARFNYFETVDENTFRRACQNMNVTYNSDLLEESNTSIIFRLKRAVARYLEDNLYDFTSESKRNDMETVLNASFANWESRIVSSLTFKFGVTEYEGKRSIIHLYVSLQFRNLNKHTIVEIDVNPRDYTA